MNFVEEIQTKGELLEWLSRTEMFEDSTEFTAFSPDAESVEDEQVLPEAKLEIWRLIKNTYLAGEYCQYGRLLLSFEAVHGWCQFQKACGAGGVEQCLSVDESNETPLALGYFDQVSRENGALKFKVLKVAELPPVDRMNQPQLGRDIAATLRSDGLLSASEISSLFAEAGHDMAWRVLADGEKPADQVVMNIGHFLQFRSLLQSDGYGMMTDCKQGQAGVVLNFSIWSKENIGMFRQAIADVLLKLDVKEVKSGNCVLTCEQYVRVASEGAGCLSEFFPGHDIR